MSILEACERGNTEAISRAIRQRQQEENDIDKMKLALQTALFNGHVDAVKCLCDLVPECRRLLDGPDLALATKQFALSALMRFGHLDMARHLIYDRWGPDDTLRVYAKEVADEESDIDEMISCLCEKTDECPLSCALLAAAKFNALDIAQDILKHTQNGLHLESNPSRDSSRVYSAGNMARAYCHDDIVDLIKTMPAYSVEANRDCHHRSDTDDISVPSYAEAFPKFPDTEQRIGDNVNLVLAEEKHKVEPEYLLWELPNNSSIYARAWTHENDDIDSEDPDFGLHSD